MKKHKMTENLVQVENFIDNNAKKSQFTYSLLKHNMNTAYYYTHEDQVVAFYYITKLNFLTLIFADELNEKLKNLIIKNLYANTNAIIKVIDQSIEYSNLLYIKEPESNNIYTAYLQNNDNIDKYKKSQYVIQLDKSHIEEYMKSIEGVFGPIDLETVERIFEIDKVYGLVREGKVLSAVTVASINEKYCIFASVFTHPRFLKKGLATELLNHVLSIYATQNRTIMIQYSTQLAKRLYLNIGFTEYHKLYVLHRKRTHLCTQKNIAKINEFIKENQDQATFIPGNMQQDDTKIYFLLQDEKITGLYAISKNHYLTILPSKNITDNNLEFLLFDSLEKTHHTGSITCQNIDLLKKYYQITGLTTLSKLEFEKKNKFKFSKNIRKLDTNDYEQYKKCYSVFQKEITFEEYKLNLKLGQIYGYFNNNNLISIATLTSITNYSCVITSVATLSNHQSKGIATSTLKHILNDIKTLDRTVYIFYNNHKGNNIYEKLGFYAYDTLQTIQKRKEL